MITPNKIEILLKKDDFSISQFITNCHAMSANTNKPDLEQNNQPLANLDVWEMDVLQRYPDPATIAKGKTTEEFRNYDEPERDTVKEFYRLNHKYQTYDFVLEKKADFLQFNKREMPIWKAFDFLNELVDDSDPDTNLDQMQHLLQTSEAIRNDGHPDWMVLVGLIHDMGKVLCLFGEPQWSVVGDTFPVGCAYSDKIVYPEFFEDNLDKNDKVYSQKYGVYSSHCGLKNVHLSWGHDEYVYHMMKDYLPEEGLYMLRYHSFYAQHRENAYDHLMDDHDREMFKWVKLFNPYDLYSKNPNQKSWEELQPYYKSLVGKYLPDTLKF
jgi:inositol oxygenase